MKRVPIRIIEQLAKNRSEQIKNELGIRFTRKDQHDLFKCLKQDIANKEITPLNIIRSL